MNNGCARLCPAKAVTPVVRPPAAEDYLAAQENFMGTSGVLKDPGG